jgi:hypothetical protein
MWEYGYANSRRLQFTEDGLAGLGNYIVKSPVGGKAWTASKNLVDPEPRTRDGRISGNKARELAKSLESGEKFAKFESLYPGYLMSAAEAFHNDVNGGCYLVARFYRKDRKFIRPKQKPKRKRKKREGRKTE